MRGKNILLLGSLIMAGLALTRTVPRKSLRHSTEIESTVIEKAICNGIAAIETAKLALQKSLSSQVKEFAQETIEEHKRINQRLITLAKQKHLFSTDDTDLVKNFGEYLLKYDEKEPFDAAYINHQLRCHEKAISLFQQAETSNNNDVRRIFHEISHLLERRLHSAEKINKEIKNKTLTATPSFEVEYGQIP